MKKLKVLFVSLLVSFCVFGLSMQANAGVAGGVVINEVYGAGGNAGAVLQNDFVELYNNSASPINLSGYRLGYASTTGLFQTTITLTGTIPANGYFLIGLAGGANGSPLPTPNQSSASINAATASGNFILLLPTSNLVTPFACPGFAIGVADRVGYGTGACSEDQVPAVKEDNVAPAPSPSTTMSIARTPTGLDTNDNAADFQIAVPTPQAAGPSAAAGTIAGRVIDENGRGLKFVTLMIAGNGLPEPLYATTNSFGHYQFQDMPLGDTYVLQVFSKRFTFKQSSLVINLDDSISNANFIGSQY